jgi:hypothetical protein
MNQSNNDVEDEDVANERYRILNKKMEDNGADHVRLVNVTKIFKKVKLKKLKIEKHLAVNNLCLGKIYSNDLKILILKKSLNITVFLLKVSVEANALA